MPSGKTRGSRIDMQELKLMVIDHLQDMRVAIDHKCDALLFEKPLHAGRPLSGIATDMSQEHLNSLNLENLKLAAFTAHHAMVDISAHSTHHRHDILQPLDNTIIADITGMPHLVAVTEILSEAVVPFPVGVAYDPNSLHFTKNS